jgi:hypothetical protein
MEISSSSSGRRSAEEKCRRSRISIKEVSGIRSQEKHLQLDSVTGAWSDA